MQHLQRATSGQMLAMIELFLSKVLEAAEFEELCKAFVPKLCEMAHLDCELLSALQVVRQLVCQTKPEGEATFDNLLNSLELSQKNPVIRVFYSSTGHGKDVLESLNQKNIQLQTQFTKALKMTTQKEIVMKMKTSSDLNDFANAVISTVQLGIAASDLQTQSMDTDVSSITNGVLESCAEAIQKCKVEEVFKWLEDEVTVFIAAEVKVFFESPEVRNVETMLNLLKMQPVMAMLKLHQATKAAQQLRAIEDLNLFAPWQA